MRDGRSFRIFVSAVSRELGSYRREVARVLRRKGLEVRDQDHFNMGPATLLEKLRDYIRECDAVILLVGERSGAFPTDEHSASLGPIAIFDGYRTASGQIGASYTQWEFLLAKHFGRKTYTFFTVPGFASDQANDEDDAARATQAAYRAWIDRSGEHRDALTTPAKLIEDVLVLDFPDLGRPKPISLPYQSLGALFKGRDDFLQRLRDSLGPIAETGTHPRASALVGRAVRGLGGIGKTRTAVEYAWRHRDDYSALLFVGAETPADLQRNLANLCGPLVLDLPEQGATEETTRVAATLRWLQDNPGWFLIIDNIDSKESAESVEKLLTSLRGGHVVITARISDWSPQVEALDLDVLLPEAATAFLLQRTDGRRRKAADDPAQALALAKELGQLALALEQAGAYIAHRRLSFEQYLIEWRTKHDVVLAWFDERVMRYPRSVAITWQTSFDRLSVPGHYLLDLAAWLAPEPIPEFLLEVPVPGADPVDLHAGLDDLDAYCLVTRDANEPLFSVHRLVQDVARRRQQLSQAQEASRSVDALRWIDEAFVGDPHDVRTWRTLDPLRSHARAVVDMTIPSPLDPIAASLMGRLATLLEGKALYQQAEPLYRRSLAIDEASYGPDHPSLQTVTDNYAELLRAMKKSEAEKLVSLAMLGVTAAMPSARKPSMWSRVRRWFGSR